MTVKSQSKIALVALLTASSLVACGDKKEAVSPEKNAAASARAVRTALVERRAITGGLVASGMLVSREEAAVSAEVTGYRVSRVLADIGDRVTAGQPMVQLDDALLRSQIDQQTALLAQAEVAARQAVAQAARVDGLDGSGALAQEQIDQRRFAAESNRAAANAQAASLKDLQTRAAKMVVRSPVSGTVLERTVRPGDLSAGGATPMFRIARDSLVELSAQVPESSLATIRVGAPATVVLPDSSRVQGVVRLIAPAVSQDTKLGEVRVALPVRSDLRPGGYGSAAFSNGAGPVLAVPEAALRYDADGVSVMTVGADNRVHEIQVKTGQRGGGYVELLSGPAPGSQVLLGASSFVLEGDVVRPLLTASPAPGQPAPTAKAPTPTTAPKAAALATPKAAVK